MTPKPQANNSEEIRKDPNTLAWLYKGRWYSQDEVQAIKSDTWNCGPRLNAALSLTYLQGYYLFRKRQ